MPNPRGRDASLDNVFHALLRLHKALLDDERVSYERVHGRISSNGELLQLVLNDAWFAWLRPLSQVIAKIDELSEESEPSAREGIPALLVSVRALLMPTEGSAGNIMTRFSEALMSCWLMRRPERYSCSLLPTRGESHESPLSRSCRLLREGFGAITRLLSQLIGVQGSRTDLQWHGGGAHLGSYAPRTVTDPGW